MKKIFTTILCTLLTLPLFSQLSNDINRSFENASSEFNIPVDILKAIAFAESRFTHHIPVVQSDGEIHPPPSYGIMGLRNDDWFGHSLIRGAQLIHQPVSMVVADVSLNIRAAAAFLAELKSRDNSVTNDLNSWKHVLEEYSGIPQNDIKEFYSYDVFFPLFNGCDENGIQIPVHIEINMNAFSERVNPKNKLKNLESDDYPSAVWSPSNNFTSGGINQKFCVVHSTEGGFAGSLSWLQNPSAQASAHYIIRSSDGYIAQMVLEANRAWHASCWNSYMLGVEHEGYVATPAYFTDTMLVTSAALYRHFCTKFSIPMDRNHIVAHGEWQNSTWKSWMASNWPSISTTCNSHTDPGQYWDWAFYLQMITQDTASPKIVSYSPSNPNDTVWTINPVKITFNQRMRKAVAQGAFSISPNVTGAFSWENLGRTIVFTPTTPMANGATYTVTVNTTARNFMEKKILGGTQFTFKTRLITPLSIATMYPQNQQTNISPSVRLIAQFDAPLMQSTLSGNFEVRDSAGSLIPIKNIIYKEDNFKGLVTVVLNQRLQAGNRYSFNIKSGLRNIQNIPLDHDSTLTFRTALILPQVGTIVDDLEAIGNWKTPLYSGSTTGIDPANTTFAISGEEAVSGTNSGKLSYVFINAAGGVCREFNATKPNIGSDITKKFGIWVNGDLSGNFLEYWFYYNTSTNVIVRVDTINWTGWKLVEIPISSITGTGDKLFHSIVLVQSPTGLKNSVLYFDAIQTSAISDVEPAGNDYLPKNYALEQNYPNPFNPMTNIRFQIPTSGFVSLKIYDILGNEVATLINETMQAGTYNVKFDATKLNSGVYFYTLRSGDFVSTKKLILLK